MLFIFSLGLAASGLVFLNETHQTSSSLHDRTLRQQARDLLTGLRVTHGEVSLQPPESWAAAYAQPGAAFAYTLFDAAGQPVALSPNIEAPLPRLDIPAGEAFSPLDIVGPDRRAFMTIAAPDGRTLTIARTDPTLESLAETLMEENGEPFAVLVISVGIAFVMVWFVAGWSLRPLARAAREATNILPGSPNAHLSPAGLPSEIQPLVEAVNGALDRLACAYDAERRFTADAAHELRTPLAVLSLRLQRAEISGSANWPAIRRDLSELNRLVSQLLDLARKEAANRATNATALDWVDFGRPVREAAAAVLPMIEGAGRTIEVETPDIAVPVRGRPDDLRDMVRNLLDNALAHGAGTIGVRLRASGTDAVLEISDQGQGVPEHLREDVFARFRKGTSTSSGSGLGLAIVRHVARAHGGDVRFVGEAAAGCHIEVRLPLEGGAGAVVVEWA
jgi:two-component system sensor histidine kinase QseC